MAEEANAKVDENSMEQDRFLPDSENVNNDVAPRATFNTVENHPGFVGLTKEELMKYANDPFWIKVRWTLFSLFWIIWCLLIGIAVYIVITAPACHQSVKSETVAIFIEDVTETVSSANQSDMKANIRAKIDQLKDIGYEILILENVLKSNNDNFNEVDDFKNVNERLNSTASFIADIVNYAKEKGIQVLLSFSPEYSAKSNELFTKSAHNESGFEDFYVWHSNDSSNLLNNWRNHYNQSAWTFHDHRKQYYLHLFNDSQPDFNFRNPAVITYFEDVFKYWLNNGIKGFHLVNTEYLVKDALFADEKPESTVHGAQESDYVYYDHSKTMDLPETRDVLQNWSTVIKSNHGLLGVTGGVLDNSSIVDFVIRSIPLDSQINATQFNKTVAYWLKNFKRPVWDWKCTNATNCAEVHGSGLTVVSYLLPGITLSNNKDMIQPMNIINEKKNNTTLSEQQNATTVQPKTKPCIKRLLEMKNFPVFDIGNYRSSVLDGTVFLFTRLKTGMPGYVVAWNMGNDTKTVNFGNAFPVIPEMMTKVPLQSVDGFKEKIQMPRSNVTIPAKEAVVFSFVNNNKEKDDH